MCNNVFMHLTNTKENKMNVTNWSYKTEWKTEADKTTAILEAYPLIGTLVKKGKTVYYTTQPEYKESTDPRNLI